MCDVKRTQEWLPVPTPRDDKSLSIELELPVYRQRRAKPFIIGVAACAALGGLIFGYDIGGAGGTFVMDGFKLHFGWACPENENAETNPCIAASQTRQDLDQGLINGLFTGGASIGSLINPYLADKYGRLPALTVSNIVFIMGAFMQIASPVMSVMWYGRFVAGMGIGMLSMCVPVYIAEVAPQKSRGWLGTLWQVAITLGILIASIANMRLELWNEGWRFSFGGNILFSIILLVAVPLMPESPRFLAAKGREDLLRAVLLKVRYEDEIEAEIDELREEVEADKQFGVASWKELIIVENKMRYRLLLGLALTALQQLSGINAVMFYAPRILQTFFGSTGAIAANFGLTSVNFASTFIAIFAIDRLGRVKLLLSGAIMMFISLVVLSLCAMIGQTETVGWFVLIFAGFFVLGFGYSWGPVVWVICAEMYPLRVRGKATGLTTMTNWIFATVVGALFPLASSVSLPWCFAFFAASILIGAVTVYLYQVETAGLTILEIDRCFAIHQRKLMRTDW